MHKPVIGLLLTTMMSLPTGAADGLKLRPVDEAAKDPALLRFRQELIQVVKKKDVTQLRLMIHPQARYFPNIKGDADQFMAEFERPEVGVWQELEKVLSLGGAFSHRRGVDSFCAPYVYSCLPKDLPDSLISELLPWAILGEGVNVRARPDPRSPVIDKLSYDLVTVLEQVQQEGVEDYAWVKITTPHRRIGWVSGGLIRDPDGYHACFEKFNGKWVLAEFSTAD